MFVRLQFGSPQSTSVGYSSSVRPDSCAPRRRNSGLPQVDKLRCCGVGVANSGDVLKRTGQIYVDLLHGFRCKRLAAAEMLTDLVRSSADTRTEHITRKVTWTNSISRKQRAGDFHVSQFTPSVYEATAVAIATQPGKSDLHPTAATETARSTWKILGTDFAPPQKRRRGFGCRSCTRNTKQYSASGQLPNCAQLYSPTGINDQNFAPRILYTEQHRTEPAAVNPGDQSGPINKQVD